jgi:hypothetical protein
MEQIGVGRYVLDQALADFLGDDDLRLLIKG